MRDRHARSEWAASALVLAMASAGFAQGMLRELPLGSSPPAMGTPVPFTAAEAVPIAPDPLLQTPTAPPKATRVARRAEPAEPEAAIAAADATAEAASVELLAPAPPQIAPEPPVVALEPAPDNAPLEPPI